jgi:hypothetical protein
MSTTEYIEVGGLMRKEGRPLFDRLAIRGIVSIETHLNLDSLISEVQEVFNVDVAAASSYVMKSWNVWQRENTMTILFRVIPDIAPHVDATFFAELSREVFSRYDMDLTDFDLYMLYNFTFSYASLLCEVPQKLFCKGIPLPACGQALLIEDMEREGKEISDFYKRMLCILSRSYREYLAVLEHSESSMTPSAPVSSEIDDIFSNMQM